LSDRCILDLDRGGGLCELPTSSGPVQIAVESASAAFTPVPPPTDGKTLVLGNREGAPFNVVVRGTTVGDGRRVTYRFTGWDIQAGTSDECKGGPRAAPKRAVAQSSATQFDSSYWGRWQNGGTAGSR
jgi:hypothetical protein